MQDPGEAEPKKTAIKDKGAVEEKQSIASTKTMLRFESQRQRKEKVEEQSTKLQ